MFAQDFLLHRISVKGEVSNCKYHTSGHIYFTIKDEQGAISAIMFAGNRRGLSFPMKEGDKVIVTGSVEVYERDGKYQLYAKTIERDGEGNLFLQFEALKRELEEMGMFAQEYKQPIPKYIRTLGIVTAPTGAAIQDIRNVARRRNPYVQLILYPALVQGDGAAESIVKGIHALENLGVDLIIVGRGGGSIEDLWAFNEEIVARAIFDCQIPVISAVGHETDWTIADFVADLRAPTPSAAAELAVYDRSALENYKQMLVLRMNHRMKQQIELNRERLSHAAKRLQYLSPANRLNENRRRVMEYEEKLVLLMNGTIQEKRNRLAVLSKALEGNSPVKKLSQGYAFVEGPDHKALKSITNIRIKDEITVQLLDGSVHAVVSEVADNE
jgi:exodeoxyribonuclease VII large subunit